MPEGFPGGFPHSDISGSMSICLSPKLFAAYHVFHRLLVPRHPPCALISLTSPLSIRVYKKGLRMYSVTSPGFGFQTFVWYRFGYSFFRRCNTLDVLIFLSDLFQYAVFKVHAVRVSLLRSVRSKAFGFLTHGVSRLCINSHACLGK